MYFLIFLGVVFVIYIMLNIDDKIIFARNQKKILRKNYTSDYRENLVEEYVSEQKNREQIMAVLENDLRFIFGDDYRKKYSLSNEDDTPKIGVINDIEKKIAIDLILSKEGLIRAESIRDGYFVMNNPDNLLVGVYLMRFAQRIEYNLNRVHKDRNLTLWYRPEIVEGSDGKLELVHSWTKGRFYWKWTWTGDDKELIRAWSDNGDPEFIKYLFSLIPKEDRVELWF